MLLCKIGIHAWEKWEFKWILLVSGGYIARQQRVCKKCGRIDWDYVE